MELKLTVKGKTMLLDALADPEYQIVFTSIQYGDGDDAGDEAEALSNVVKTFQFSQEPEVISGEYVRLTTAFNNSALDESFEVKETGVLVKDPENPDDRTKDILFAYGHTSEGEQPIVVPAKTEYSFTTTDSVLVYIGRVENITAIISGGLNYVTQEELDAHIRAENAHNADQVGLGNVPNVSTDNQVPTVGEIDDNIQDDLLKLQTGAVETLSTIMGKIANVIHRFFLHKNDTNNPHEVTAAQVGAANAVHNHSASNITTGILGLERGGTGVTSQQALVALVSEGISTLTEKGSYTGTGMYGAAHKNSITYPTDSNNNPRNPKMLLVQPQSEGNARLQGFVCLYGVTNIICGGIADSQSYGGPTLTLNWLSNKVEWYTTLDSAGIQMNTQGMTYHYMFVF